VEQKGTAMHEIQLIHGDCLDVMKSMVDNSIDFIVTDPPYGLNFMGKKWDSCVPNIEIWKEALRVCKPGSMLAAFGGSRTHHHLMIALEQAGWEIRDVIVWLYSQGFPKSHNKFGLYGYGTALKPAYEPIIICMKPIDGTFANNVKICGIGGINIDCSRIPTNEKWNSSGELVAGKSLGIYADGLNNCGRSGSNMNGRWPANIILDEESAKLLDEQTGILKSGKMRGNISSESKNKIYGKRNLANINEFEFNSGGASRFFYCAKSSQNERGKQNNHPCVKPIKLMEYIIKLLAPPNNPICLDPFCGSGSTGIAAKNLGIKFIGIDKEKEYIEIANERLHEKLEKEKINE
jgi:DNA modification methylase